MKTILTERVIHKNEKRIKLIFNFDVEIMNILDSFEDVAWSSSMNCWHVKYDENYFSDLQQRFKGISKIVDRSSSKRRDLNHDLSMDHNQALHKFNVFMKNRRYSSSTIFNYNKRIKDFLKFYFDKEIDLINNEDVNYYNYEHMIKRKSSYTIQNQFLTALKLFLNTTSESKIDIEKIERAKGTRKLPEVFSKKEIEKIIKATQNLKHKTILHITYGCGLRRSEIGKIRIQDINPERKLILIRNAKGRKDRLVPLSENLADVLRAYYKIYTPQRYLFETKPGISYPAETAYKVFKNALEKSGVKKKVGIHTLRHSYATHLLENGTDLRYIQEILGHKSSKTTEIYTHVSNQNISKINSPADDLDL
jgi:integrase/recombinase XerD